jgi:poly-gamma-glutamate synthesis protein (capsule biosynthesis protein)
MRWMLVAGAAAVLVAIAGAWFVWQQSENGGTPASPQQNQQADNSSSGEAAYTDVEGSYIFSGTIVIGRAVERAAQKPDGSYDLNQPFSGLSSIGYDKYDAGVIDLECPSTGRRVSYQESVNNLVFDCHPEWFQTLGDYYQVMNIAGNHTYDAGPEGFEKTVANIQNAGLQAVGHYSPRETDDLCEVVAMPVRLQKRGGGEEQGMLPLAICSVHYQFHLAPEPGELEIIQQYAEIMPVIGMMHSGVEYTAQATPLQQEVAHKMIDYGAAFVIGNGAHWVQNTEVYKGKLITYSTGNFIFDQLGYEERLGLSIAADMDVPYDQNVAEWLRLGSTCTAREDTCLEDARQRGLHKIQPAFTFEAVGSFGGYQRVTEKANAQQLRDIEQRANWPQTLQQLGQE